MDRKLDDTSSLLLLAHDNQNNDFSIDNERKPDRDSMQGILFSPPLIA